MNLFKHVFEEQFCSILVQKPFWPGRGDWRSNTPLSIVMYPNGNASAVICFVCHKIIHYIMQPRCYHPNQKVFSKVKQVVIFWWKLFLWNNVKSAREANCEIRPLWDPCVVSLSHWVVSYTDMLLCLLISWHAWYLFISMHNYPSQSVMPDFVWRRLIKCRLITSLWFLFSSPVRGVGSAGNVPQPGVTQHHDLVNGLDKKILRCFY